MAGLNAEMTGKDVRTQLSLRIIVRGNIAQYVILSVILRLHLHILFCQYHRHSPLPGLQEYLVIAVSGAGNQDKIINTRIQKTVYILDLPLQALFLWRMVNQLRPSSPGRLLKALNLSCFPGRQRF